MERRRSRCLQLNCCPDMELNHSLTDQHANHCAIAISNILIFSFIITDVFINFFCRPQSHARRRTRADIINLTGFSSWHVFDDVRCIHLVFASAIITHVSRSSGWVSFTNEDVISGRSDSAALLWVAKNNISPRFGCTDALSVGGERSRSPDLLSVSHRWNVCFSDSLSVDSSAPMPVYRFLRVLIILYASMYVCLPLSLPVYLPVSLYVCVSVVYLSVCLYICLYLYLPFCLSIYLSVCLFIWLSVYLYVCPSVHLSLRLHACLCACLYVVCPYVCL